MTLGKFVGLEQRKKRGEIDWMRIYLRKDIKRYHQWVQKKEIAEQNMKKYEQRKVIREMKLNAWKIELQKEMGKNGLNSRKIPKFKKEEESNERTINN